MQSYSLQEYSREGTYTHTDEMNTDIDRRDFSDMQSVLLHARSPVRKCI